MLCPYFFEGRVSVGLELGSGYFTITVPAMSLPPADP
jgi:hypothetical protein